MTFAAPQVLWLLVPVVPGLLVFFWRVSRKRDALMTQFVAARLLPTLVVGRSRTRERFRQVCLLLSCVLILLALARPQWGFTWQEVKQRGVDIVVAIDCSKSMLAQDITPNRLARAKLAALELMQKARTDRLGLVAFAGSAFLACPLTIDDVAFAQSVEALDVNTISSGGTALAEAIEASLAAFKEADNHKLLVLITDGEDHDSNALAAAQRAAQAGLKIYTVGVGTPQGELIRITDPQGRPDYIRDEEGNVVKSRLDEQLLASIAGTTQGGFYLLRGANTIDALYDQGLSFAPKSEHEQKLVKQNQQRFYWPLGIAILLLIIEKILPERGGAARKQTLVSRKSAVTAASMILLCNTTLCSAASSGAALRHYKSREYDAALRQYEELLKRNPDDPRLHFNAGTAAYRRGKYDDAAKHFEKAVTTPDLRLQESAYFNRGNSFYFAGEAVPEPQKRMASWEKALKDFELCTKLDPDDQDAKSNFEFVKRKLDELKQQQQQQSKPENIQPSDAAKRAKAEADKCVAQKRYREALEIMEKQLAVDATTRFYSDYIERLKEVNGVQDSAH